MGFSGGDSADAYSCADIHGHSDGQWNIKLNSQVLVSTSATFFGLLIIFGVFIFVKYLVIRSACQRLPMMIFYLLTLVDLGSRMAIMVELNYAEFFDEWILILSVISLMFALMVGTSHAYILSTLTIDLKTLKCQSEGDYERVRRLRLIYLIVIFVWIAILIINVAFFIYVREYGYTMLIEAILFSLQAIGLLGINWQLNTVLSGLFSED